MVLLFSAMMLVGLLLFSSYAIDFSIQGANVMTETRFRNMSTSIERGLEQEYDMMVMTLQELTSNTTFMAALNQIIRDDSEDQKMARSAERIAQQQLIESPLVDMYYRVSFYTRDGVFLSSYINKDSTLSSRTARARSIISGLPWLDTADSTDGTVCIPTTRDYFSLRASDEVYGIARSVAYHGTPIGYISVVNRYKNLSWIMNYLDEPDICVEVVFDDGSILYRNQDVSWSWPAGLAAETLTTLAMEDGSSRMVYSARLNFAGATLFISQNSAVAENGRKMLRSSMMNRALLILVPTIILIILVAVGLTRSIRKLTRKVRHISTASVFRQNDETTRQLLAPVTKPSDQETYTLEQVFDRLMVRLRDSTANELALREGTLQAQLSALQTQINPHFIYNTLNIISAKSMESGNYDVIEICDQFAGMLRYSTDTRSRTATLAEEIENVRRYLTLAKARYEDNLEYTISVPENINEIIVPKLTLQPLVENAMTHGFSGTNETRKLSVSGEIRDRKLILEIRDNGTGFSEEMLQSLRERIHEIELGHVSIEEESGGHIGLVNTCLRLHYYSHGKMRVAIRNEDGAVITLVMPFEEKSVPD